MIDHYTTRQVSRIAGISVQAVRKHRDRHGYGVYKDGQLWFTSGELDEIIERSERGPGPVPR